MSVEWMDGSGGTALPVDSTPERSLSRSLAVFLAVVALGSGVVGFALGKRSDDHTATTTLSRMHGVVVLSDWLSAGTPTGPDVCWSDGADVHAGSPVLVLNTNATKVIGATLLRQGVAVGKSCELAFEVSVPDDLGKYVVQIGGRPDWGVVSHTHLSDARIPVA